MYMHVHRERNRVRPSRHSISWPRPRSSIHVRSLHCRLQRPLGFQTEGVAPSASGQFVGKPEQSHPNRNSLLPKVRWPQTRSESTTQCVPAENPPIVAEHCCATCPPPDGCCFVANLNQTVVGVAPVIVVPGDAVFRLPVVPDQVHRCC